MTNASEEQSPRELADAAERRRIEQELGINMLVEAAAGTGKTTSMVGRMVSLIRSGTCDVGAIAAVTFTRKAAAELRARFQVALERAARDETEAAPRKRLRDAVNHVERCFIGTIHAFCARMLRERPIEAGVDLSFREIEEQVDSALRSQAWNEYVAALHTRDDDILTELDSLGITGFLTNRDEVLEELNELGLDIAQLEDMFHRFVGYPDVDDWPTEHVELPDTAQLFAEIENYVSHMVEMAPSFPDDRGNDELMRFYEDMPRFVRRANPRRPADVMNLIGMFHRSINHVQNKWPGGQKGTGKREVTRYRDFVAQTERARNQWLERRYETIFRVLRPARDVYDTIRERAGVLNFQDLLVKTAGMLRDNPDVRRYFRNRFSHVLVDEFQDTDPVQAEVMLLLTADDTHETRWQHCRPVPGSLFVVGDPKQSIYRFRRADIVTFNQVKRIIAEDSTRGAVIELSTNFRSSGTVVNWINRVFADKFSSDESNRFSPTYTPLQIGRHDVHAEDSATVMGLRPQYESLGFEAELIARSIRHAIDTHAPVARTRHELKADASKTARPSDFMILTLEKSHLSEIARALNRLGVPHELTGGKDTSWLIEVRMLSQWVAALNEPENSVALVAVLRGELCGFSDPELYCFRRDGGRFDYRSDVSNEKEDPVVVRFADVFAQMRRHSSWLRELPICAAVERIVADLGLTARALAATGGQLRAGGLLRVIELIRDARDELLSAGHVVEFLDSLTTSGAEFNVIPAGETTADRVRLMNLHKAKGLEAPIVFLVAGGGRRSRTPNIHIDRTGDQPRGYAAVHGKRPGGAKAKYVSPPLLALPPDWDNHKEVEKQFAEAEYVRLMYVAATRAQSQLVVVDRNKKSNPWQMFSSHLSGHPDLPDPGPQQPPTEKTESLSLADLEQSTTRITENWQASREPTYAHIAAKQYALAGKQRPVSNADGLGAAWGNLIHTLLDRLMRNPSLDIERSAESAMNEHRDLLAKDDDTKELAREAAVTVRSVAKSQLWQRAQQSESCLTEVPFQLLASDELIPNSADSDIPRLVSGVIDLAFLDQKGWVLVDFKTDAIGVGGESELTEFYRDQLQTYATAWRQMTSQPVEELGFFFTATERYVSV